MPSSTSSSSGLNAKRAMLALFVLLALYFAALEVASRTLLPRVSEGQRRMATDALAARQLRPGTDGTKTVLIVGNSLLLNAVDRASLIKNLSPQYRVSLYPVEG